MTPNRFLSWFFSGGLLGLLAAALATFNPVSPPNANAAPPEKPQLPTEFQYVPHDAGIFFHLDAAAVWSSEVLKNFSAADKESIAKLEALVTLTFGAKLENLKTATLFFPKIKEPRDAEHFGVILRFDKKFDEEKLKSGFAGLAAKDVKIKILSPSETIAVVLVGLDASEYGKPQPANSEGPMTAQIQAAATGKHTLVAGYTLANLPNVAEFDTAEVRVLKPILESNAIHFTVDLGQSLTLDVRVKAKRAAQAKEAEKALSVFADMVVKELSNELPGLEKNAQKDAGLKDLLKVFQTGLDAVKNAKYSVEGNDAKFTATLPLKDLPLASAYVAGVRWLERGAAVNTSTNNLKQIVLAMHNYHDAKGSLPPAAVCDKKGKPLLSWRVLILPYIEQEALYKEFKLDEPWDSDHNKKLIAKMPATFRLPGSKPGTTDTHYRVFVGNGAAFDWVAGPKLQNIADGTSSTIMVITAADAVPWTKPDELEYDPEKDPSKLFGFVVNDQMQIGLCDGSIRTIKKLPSAKTLHALITRAGGEVIGEDF